MVRLTGCFWHLYLYIVRLPRRRHFQRFCPPHKRYPKIGSTRSAHLFPETLEDSDEIRTRHEAIHLLGGRRQFVAGAVEDVWEYNSQLSVSKMEGFADYVSVPMEGQCSSVFWARTLLNRLMPRPYLIRVLQCFPVRTLKFLIITFISLICLHSLACVRGSL